MCSVPLLETSVKVIRVIFVRVCGLQMQKFSCFSASVQNWVVVVLWLSFVGDAFSRIQPAQLCENGTPCVQIPTSSCCRFADWS